MAARCPTHRATPPRRRLTTTSRPPPRWASPRARPPRPPRPGRPPRPRLPDRTRLAVKAVVLVGGLGTRLRPLTLSTPKQMLPVANRATIERVVQHLARHGVETAVLALGYRPGAFA